MATREQLEAEKTKLHKQAMDIAERRREIDEELDHMVNEEAIERMSPSLKRQVLEVAGVKSEEAFGKLGI